LDRFGCIITGESQNIQQHGPFEGPDQIYISNGQGLSIKSSGYTKFVSPINPRVSLPLKQLLHVPAITENLISVSKFSKDNNVFFEFYPNHCAVKSQGTNEVLLQGSDGLYIFPHLAVKDFVSATCLLSNSNVDSVVTSVSSGSNTQISDSFVNIVSDVKTTPSTSSQTIWHLRLGHPNANVLRLVLNHCNILIVFFFISKFINCINNCEYQRY